MRRTGFILLTLLLVSLLTLSPTVAYAKPGKPPSEEATPTQNLIESPDGGAAAWDHTTLTILINPNVYSPDSPEVSAGRRAIDHWKASIAWFSTQDWDRNGEADYPWLNQINFIIYVQGVNATESTYDVTITYYYKITPGYILGSTSLSFEQVDGGYAIQSVDIVLGVKGLSIIGIENLVAHEFGHALGLEHSNKKGDLMYPSFDVTEEKKSIIPPSTLNLYALTISHSWLSTDLFSEYKGSLAITLPANIPYQKAP
jgi:hypothetical protein